MSATTAAYRRQPAYNASSQQTRGLPPPAPSSSTVTRSAASSRLRQQPAQQAFRIEQGLRADGSSREIIVIDDDDSPPPSTDSRASTATTRAAPPAASTSTSAQVAKRRRTNAAQQAAAIAQQQQQQAAYHAYPAYAAQAYAAAAAAPLPAEASRKVAASGVGGKRKAVDPAGPSRAKKEAAPPCDDKEGHFIVREGDSLRQGRYRIERLLGQGTFGKVVEALDARTNTWVAVKIIRSVQKYRDASKVEIKVLNLLRERDPDNNNNCIHLVDWFDDRNHICIVTELLSVSVFDFLKENNYHPFPDAHIQHFAKQLMKSVAFLHELQLIHTDLKPENILLVDQESRPVRKPHSTRTYQVLTNSSIRLIDFGSATFQSEYHASVVSTRHYRAPEIILGLGWSFPCDVWSIGCILVEFLTGEALFQTHDNLEHLAMMEKVFGRMPDNYGRLGSRAKPEWFRSSKLDFPKPDTTRQSRKYVNQMKKLEEIVPKSTILGSRFHDLLMKLLEWDASKRISVRDALKHPYFAMSIEEP